MIYRKWPKIFFLFIHYIHSECPQDGNISKHQSDARPDGMLKHFNAELIVPKSTHQIIHANRFFILRPFQRNVESALHISNEFLSCWHFSSVSSGLYWFLVPFQYSSELRNICKMNCSEFGQQKNLQRPDLKKTVAKHSAKLKAKNIFPLLPSTTYILDKSQSVSISKTDADIYTS